MSWLELDSALSALNATGVKNTAFLQHLLKSLFFDAQALLMETSEYLCQYLEAQKIEIFKRVLSDKFILNDFKLFLNNKGRSHVLKKAATTLAELIDKKAYKLNDFTAVNNIIFPHIAAYFGLEYQIIH